MRKVPVFLRGGRLAGLAQDDLQHDDNHDGRNADQVGRQLRVDQAQAAGGEQDALPPGCVRDDVALERDVMMTCTAASTP